MNSYEGRAFCTKCRFQFEWQTKSLLDWAKIEEAGSCPDCCEPGTLKIEFKASEVKKSQRDFNESLFGLLMSNQERWSEK